MTAVLVTGGAGYVGSHACKALARAGLLPITYDSLVTGHDWAVQWGPLERGDILDADRLANVIGRYRPTAVLHFAAFASVAESVVDPAKYYGNNVVGTVNLLDAMLQNGVRHIVFSSSCATYGIPQAVPISEDTPQQPINPYGESKLMIERILNDYRNAYGVRSISLRYFNAAGADLDGDLGEEHEPETHLIPLALAAAAQRRPAVTIFGDDYDTPDGTCIRDFVHVSDLADAHVLALKALEKETTRHAYNLGTGRGHSVAEVIEVARAVTRRPIPVIMAARRPGDPPRLLADPTRAIEDLDWAPRHVGIIDSVETAWRWMSRNEEISTRTVRVGHG